MQEYRNQSLKMLKIENGHDHGNFHIQKLFVSIVYLGPDEKLCALLQNHDQMLLTTKSKESIVDTNLNLYSNIMRCGRELDEENSFCWRWTGFNYGLRFQSGRFASTLDSIKWGTSCRWSSLLPHAEFGSNRHREDAPHFTI